MFGPDYAAGCPACSAIADGFNGIASHLANHDVMLWAVSRAPIEKLQAYKRRMGWTFPWASSFGSDFNYDFDASYHPGRSSARASNTTTSASAVVLRGSEGGEIPSRTTPDGPAIGAALSGTDVATYTRERPGMSAFALEDGIIYHTYSAYARGLDILWGMYQWLDRAPKGATKPASGGAATTNTSRFLRTPTHVAPQRKCAGVNARLGKHRVAIRSAR